MTPKPNVVPLPLPKDARLPVTDERLAAEVHAAQRKLKRALKRALAAGLSVRMGKDIGDPIQVSRVWKGRR